MPKGSRWNPILHQWERPALTAQAAASDDNESWALLISYWRWYPDRLLALLEAADSSYSLALIQAINLRINARYAQTFITGSRGLTKTYSSVLGKMVDGLLWPGELIRYYGPALNQTAEIVAAAYHQIGKNYPLLAAHWKVKACAKDTFKIQTETGSTLDITTMRGDTAHQVLCEEVGQEEQPIFDFKEYRSVVLPSIRAQHQVDRRADPLHIDFKKQYITSASRQAGEAYQFRSDILSDMRVGGSAYVIDYPWTAAVLSGIRSLSWAEDLRRKLTPEEWLREMESVYTGSTENPVIRDSVLSEAKQLRVAELRHCGDPQAIYVIGYDVSHEEGARRAKCALAVVKLTPQCGRAKEGTFLKQLVYVADMLPQEAPIQARYLKAMWLRYTMEGGAGTYIAIDNRQYGKAVTEYLLRDLGDGLPLGCWNHEYPQLTLPGALPVIYPVVATNGYREGGHGDPDGEMIKYAELQFEHHNVRILVTSVADGVAAYKAAHNIRGIEGDAELAVPYAKCREMCAQIANLKKKRSAMNWSEARISKSIQRDMWSAFKYALRFAQLLERRHMIESVRRESDWTPAIEAARRQPQVVHGYRPRVIGRTGRLQ